MRRDEQILPPEVKQSLGVIALVAVVVLGAIAAGWILELTIQVVGNGFKWVADRTLKPVLQVVFDWFR